MTLSVLRDGRRVTAVGPRRTIRVQGRWIWGFEPATKLVTYPLGHSATRAASDLLDVVTGTIRPTFGSSSMLPTHGRARLSRPRSGSSTRPRTPQRCRSACRTWYLQIVGLVSMSLALLNLLPLLPLDGGHILFSIIEGVRRRALAREVYERVSVIGIALHHARVRDRVLRTTSSGAATSLKCLSVL